MFSLLLRPIDRGEMLISDLLASPTCADRKSNSMETKFQRTLAILASRPKFWPGNWPQQVGLGLGLEHLASVLFIWPRKSAISNEK